MHPSYNHIIIEEQGFYVTLNKIDDRAPKSLSPISNPCNQSSSWLQTKQKFN